MQVRACINVNSIVEKGLFIKCVHDRAYITLQLLDELPMLILSAFMLFAL